jgi:hypothetical protein
MSIQNLRHTPELVDERQLQSKPAKAHPREAENSRPTPIVVTLSEQSLWDEIGTMDRAGVVPSSAAAFVMAGLGIAVVTYLWSVIIF